MAKQALVLFSYRSHKHGYIEMLFDRLQHGAEGRALVLHRGSLNDAHIVVCDNKLSITEQLTGRDLASFDVIYFELWYKAQQQALAFATYARRHNIPFFSREIGQILPMSKVGEIAVLADNDVPLPDTFISSRRELLRVFKTNPPLDYPVIVKAADGYGGKSNYLVHDYAQLKTILNENKGVQFVVQEYIPNDRDYRCIVFGGEIQFVLERVRAADSDSHLNNTSAGAEGIQYPVAKLSLAAKDAVLRAAHAVGRDSFAGVDLMLHQETGAPYILEVNQTPQIEIGAEVDKKMSALLDHMEAI